MAEQLSISFEFFPPSSETAEARLWSTVEKLAPLAQPSRRSPTAALRGAPEGGEAENDGRMEPAAHLTCIGANKAEINNIAKDWLERGITRLVALRGDPPQGSARYEPHPNGYANAADLVSGLRRIGDFDMSVAASPETHPDSPSEAADIANLKMKIDNGARRAITQYFFDVDMFLRFRDKLAKAGIDAPLVPGIMPISHFGRMVNFSKRCGTYIPGWLFDRFEGLDRTHRHALVAANAPISTVLLRREDLHFYTLNAPSLTFATCRLLGVRPTFSEAA